MRVRASRTWYRLHSPVYGDVIDLDAAFGEQFLDIAI
jgi:hypothetical protein